MKFEIIIGNPPYQTNNEDRPETKDPLYNKFIEKALLFDYDYISFIVPSRWMNGGKNLDDFRYKMINLNKFVSIHDYKSSSKIFNTVYIDGGICHFLISHDDVEYTEYKFIDDDNQQYVSKRKLSEENLGVIIRDSRQLKIINKILSRNDITFDSIVSKRNCYGFPTDLFNRPENYKEANLQENYVDGYYKIYGVKGIRGDKRVSGYINYESIKENKEYSNKYNIFFGYAYNLKSTTPAKRILSVPGELCTETFLNIGPFETKEEQLNCEKYISTKFFRALLYFHRFQKNSTYRTFEFIPLIDFNREPSDEELYKTFGLGDSEIEYINTIIE